MRESRFKVSRKFILGLCLSESSLVLVESESQSTLRGSVLEERYGWKRRRGIMESDRKCHCVAGVEGKKSGLEWDL